MVDYEFKKDGTVDILCIFVYQQQCENLFLSFHKYL